MTIDEAIKIKLIWKESGYAPPGPNEINADDISIEALKRIKDIRPFENNPGIYRLPGETKPVYRGMTETMFINPERD